MLHRVLSVARRFARTDLAVLALAVLAVGAVAVFLGADGNGDLRNYHLYGGWALLHKPVGYDVAPAQLQTYHHPGIDALFVLLAKALNQSPRLFTFLWAVPQAVAAWLGFLVARRCLPRSLALLAFAIGATGATSLGTAGTSLSEGIPNALVLAAVLLVLRADARAGPGAARSYALAGALAGAGAVLKLTAAPYLIGFGGATLFAFAFDRRVWRVRAAFAFAGAALLAALAVGGPWWLAVYRAFGNPLFPYYNAVFQSPLYPARNFFDLRFLPQTASEWLLYPLDWSFWTSTRTTEQPVRDPRLLLEVLAGLALLLASPWRRGPASWVAAYVLCTYVVWLRFFSILRYASGLEVLSGVVIVAALALLPAWRVTAAVATAALVVAVTTVPRWDRRPHPGKRLFAVTMSPLPPDSTVLIFGLWEKAFIATTQPASVRWIGLQNNLVWFDLPIGLDRVIEADVAAATGPIWSITDRPEPTADEQRWFARLHLRQTGQCAPVLSTISPPYTICRLQPL